MLNYWCADQHPNGKSYGVETTINLILRGINTKGEK
jgi:hypothetical protein